MQAKIENLLDSRFHGQLNDIWAGETLSLGELGEIAYHLEANHGCHRASAVQVTFKFLDKGCGDLTHTAPSPSKKRTVTLSLIGICVLYSIQTGKSCGPNR